MGRAARPKPLRLPEKLLRIRIEIGLSQTQMLVRLDLDERLFRSAVSGYELGTREPPLPILLEYSRIAGVWLDVLVDDELDLPEKLPANPKSEGIRRKKSSRGKKH